jgi:hypothetical protein
VDGKPAGRRRRTREERAGERENFDQEGAGHVKKKKKKKKKMVITEYAKAKK